MFTMHMEVTIMKTQQSSENMEVSWRGSKTMGFRAVWPGGGLRNGRSPS